MNRRKPYLQAAKDYERVAKAIRYLETHCREQPDLATLAGSVHLSKHHFHRLFKRWAGVTPGQFLSLLTIDYSRELLRRSHSLLAASLAAGLSSGSRLHDHFVTCEAVTPGEYRQYGRGLAIVYGSHPTPFGTAFLAATGRGICFLGFLAPGGEAEALAQLRNEWPGAVLTFDPAATGLVIERMFKGNVHGEPFNLVLKGTNFQVQVWRALLQLPAGARISYQDMAALAGRPDAVRAVAGAVAANPVAYLIPCHRVISKSGELHRYRWGAARKKALVGREAARALVESEIEGQ